MMKQGESVWRSRVTAPRLEPLAGSCSTDVLVIGGGIAGIMIADELTRRGVDCILVEANRLCSGVSGKTNAKVTYCHGLIYDRLIRERGREAARLYLEAQRAAARRIEEIARSFDCDYEKKVSYVYSRDDEAALFAEAEALISLGVEAEVVDIPELPVKNVGAVRVVEQAQLDPLKLAYGVAKGIRAYESTRVTELSENRAKTDGGEIFFKRAVVATHFPILNKHGAYFMKMYQHRSYVLALEGAEMPIDGIIVDESDGGLSLRSCSGLVLLSGGGHRTGKQGGGWDGLLRLVGEKLPNAKVVSRYATQDCMTLDRLPYVGKYSRSTQNLYVATGFNKWGMTSSLVAASVLGDMLTGEGSPYSQLLSPSRSVLKPQLLKNLAETAVGLLNLRRPRCPHLGCALRYNAAEHTWDCPCHGSRFTRDGGLIDGPANVGMKDFQ